MAQTVARATPRKSHPIPYGKIKLGLAANGKVVQGCMATVDSSGNITNPAESDAGAFAVFVLETVDNTGGSAGDVEAEVEFGGVYLFESKGADPDLDNSDLGTVVYASDNETFTTTSGTNTRIGRIYEILTVDRAYVRVEGWSN